LSDEFGEIRNEDVFVGLRYSFISGHGHLTDTEQNEFSGNAAWILKSRSFQDEATLSADVVGGKCV